MKRVLITGAGSYIGTSVEQWLNQWPNAYQVDTIDMIDGFWREKSFSGYDAVFHVAGIAHADVGKVSETKKAFYYKVNTELAVETAKKAKVDGIQQFIFMSSAIVYGESAPIGKKKVITRDTIPSPANFYGDSKLQAENRILPLANEKFRVVILRPPMIYGKGSKGNYPLLSKLAKKLPVFPDIKNERSMLYVDNLCEFIRLMIENEESGVFFPQNEEYVQTSQMVKLIASISGKKIRIWRIMNPLIILLGKFPGKMGGMVNKAFGNMVYDNQLSVYRQRYQVCDLQDSIWRTERII